ncbi:MAG: hypothetical protein JWM59_147 [Verrucomicrobiales bacterium]|nr:hypothetical protein [Verrucomicrobiales bacterium]
MTTMQAPPSLAIAGEGLFAICSLIHEQETGIVVCS